MYYYISMKVIYDLHTHTIFSHGKGTIEDNVKVAKEKGLTKVAITDHGFEHLSFAVNRKNLPFMKSECERLSKKYEIDVLLGVEANLLDKTGRIDVLEKDMKYLDIIIMGYHKMLKPKLKQLIFSIKTKIFKTKKQIEETTNAYIKAIEKYDIKVLTHLNYGVKCDVKKIADACKEKGVLIELNSKRICFSKDEIDYMKKIGTKFIISSDAHSPQRVGEANLAYSFILKNDIDLNNVVNCEWRSMSFILDAKKEILTKLNKTLTNETSLSVLYAIFKTICEININYNEINSIYSNEDLLPLINNCLNKLGYEEAEFELDDEKGIKGNFKYRITFGKSVSKFLLNEFIYKTDFELNYDLIKTDNQKIDFLKTIFIITSTGNIKLNSEENGYLTEFVVNDNDLASLILDLLSNFDIFAKKVERRGQFVVYLNKFEQISDLLALLGATNSMLKLNNENAIRSVRNNINRQNNCLEANISKTISASLKQIDAINFIDSTIGISSLDPTLQDVALLRIANKEESLDNLVKLCNFEISKSGLNHRLNKIIKISNSLKDKF